MNYVFVIGVLSLLSGGLTIVFLRNKYDIERKKYNLILLPIAVAGALIVDDFEVTQDSIITIIISIIVACIVIISVYLMIGFHIRTYARKDEVVRSIGDLEGFSREEKYSSANKIVFVNRKEKIRIYDYNSRGCMVVIDTSIKKMRTRVKVVENKLILLDPSKTAVREGVIYLGFGLIALLIYILTI